MVHAVLKKHGILFHGCYTGTKNVARELKKVSVGRVAAGGKTWFPELADKSKSYIVCALL